MRFGMMGLTVAVLAAAVPMAARAQGGAEEAARGFVARLAARDFDAAGAMVEPRMARAFQQQELSMQLAFAQFRASGAPRGNNFAVSAADSVDPTMLAR